MKLNSNFLLKPIKSWMQNPKVTEIVLNKPGEIFIEIDTHFSCHAVPEFTSSYLQRLFRLLANENGQVFSEKQPALSGALLDGSRIQLLGPPISTHYSFAIRKHAQRRFALETLADCEFFSHLSNSDKKEGEPLLSYYFDSKDWFNFIKQSVLLRKNIVISGETSSGKTSLLNACLNEIPKTERLIVLEDTPEIKLTQPNVLHMYTKSEAQHGVSFDMQALIQCCLRLRPDRIIVGEIRGKEILEFLATCITGHRGSITSIHADSVENALLRMMQLYKQNPRSAMKDEDIRQEIHQAVDIILQLKKTAQGRRLVDVYWVGSV